MEKSSKIWFSNPSMGFIQHSYQSNFPFIWQDRCKKIIVQCHNLKLKKRMDFSLRSMWHDTKANAHPFLRLHFVQAGRLWPRLWCLKTNFWYWLLPIFLRIIWSKLILWMYFHIHNSFTGKIIQGVQIFGSQSPPPRCVLKNEFLSQEVIGNI